MVLFPGMVSTMQVHRSWGKVFTNTHFLPLFIGLNKLLQFKVTVWGIEELWKQKARQRSSRLFGGQNFFNFLPPLVFCFGRFGRNGWIQPFHPYRPAEFYCFFKIDRGNTASPVWGDCKLMYCRRTILWRFGSDSDILYGI